MGKKFYAVIFCVLSCSVLLLGMSYSKNSNDSVGSDLIESSNDSFRVVYSMDKNLDTRDNNELRLSLINKKSTDTQYALYLKEIDNDIVENVYYSINDGEDYLLTDNVIYLGEFSKYGTLGDASTFKVTLKGLDNYSFYYSIGEYKVLDEVSYGS